MKVKPISGFPRTTSTDRHDTQAICPPSTIQGPAPARASGIASGTRLLTPRGYRNLESLRRGDQVAALIGRGPLFVPIAWVGRRTIQLPADADASMLPVRIRAGAIADAMPMRDLVLAPDHAIYWQGTLFLARQLINQSSIAADADTRSVDYWGIQLHRHDLLIAENLPIESLLPGNAAAFNAVTGPPLHLVDVADDVDEASASASIEISSTIRMSVRWFRRQMLRRPAASPQHAHDAAPPPDGLLDVQTEVRAVANDFAWLASQRGVRLMFAVEPRLAVRMDRDRLRELLGAMLTHAIHAKSTGRVLLGAMRHAGRVQIAVIDEATGVDRATQQAELQHAMQLAAMQGATLEVDVRPNEGTTLLLRLLAP